MKKNIILLVTAISMAITSCTIVKPGEVGIKQTFGVLHGDPKTEGPVFYNPFVTKIIRIRTNTANREVKLNLPSKEGLNVNAEISILYHVDYEKVQEVIRGVGLDYERILILSTFRSSAADVCARFYAKDMHSGKRSEIEAAIKKQMTELLKDRGIIIEAILMKSISLPTGLYDAIEAKLEAEQRAQQMQFVLDQEKQEAERKRIEAEGVKTAQQILQQGITDENIQWKSLEVFKDLSNSPNTKIIITNGGSTPLMMNALDSAKE